MKIIMIDYDNILYNEDEERYDRSERSPKYIGTCCECGEDIFDDAEYYTSYDGAFCDMICCHKFYDIKTNE